MNEFEIKFRDYLKNKGLHCTSARMNILRAVYIIRGHFCVEDVLHFLGDTDRYVSRATIYRIINLLVDGGFISEITIYNGRALYEWSLGKEPHDHLVCITCGKIIEVHKQRFENPTKEVLNKKPIGIFFFEIKINPQSERNNKNIQTGVLYSKG